MKKMEVKYPLAQVSVFLWIGFVCAISFMEAWLKFLAPGITVPLGLGIGRIVFAALNIMEWLFAILILGNLLYSSGKVFTNRNWLYFVPLLLLTVQSVWLLPALDTRAELRIQAVEAPESNLHFYYVGIEVAKVVCLFIFGINLYKRCE